jgi:hypothetical protein
VETEFPSEKENERVNASGFRSLALNLPEAVEDAHMGHPDFRVRGKIFATLGPDEDWAMVKLTPEQQASYLQAEPDVFEPCNGAWGRGGATKVQLASAQETSIGLVLIHAWRNTAPKGLVQQFDDA